MAKFYGKIGFADTEETDPGLWVETITARPYVGDLVSNRWMRKDADKINDDINISNQISIVADPYAMNHCSTMVYVEFMGAKWKVTNVEVQYPRLVLTVGGVWNGPEA